MDLTNTKISETYPNVLTVGTAQNATAGELTNGLNQPITSLTHNGDFYVDKIKYNGLIIADINSADGTDINTTAILDSGLNVISVATSNDKAVRLPSPLFGKVVNIVNTSGVDIFVFPYDATSSIYGKPVGEHVIVPSDGLMYTFTCVQNPNVGVWVFVTPAGASGNTDRITVEYDMTLITDSAQTGLNIISEGFIGATNTVISNTPYLCALGVPNFADALVLWNPVFSNYNEIALVNVEVLSDLPVGDLNDPNGQTPAAALGISDAQFNTIGLSVGAATKDFSVSCGSFAGPVRQTEFSGGYNYVYSFNGGPAGLSVIPRIALPGDPGVAGQVYQAYQNSFASPFEPLFDANGNVAKFFMVTGYIGTDQYPQHAFPNGTQVNFKAKVTFDLKK